MSLKIEHLDHVYAQNSPFEFKALDDVNVELENGHFIALIGHTGSGKSTLIQHLNGLIEPTSGTVYLNGVDIFNQSKEDLVKTRFSVGLVFQYPEHQLFEETIAGVLAMKPEVLILDEPTAGLDPHGRDTILGQIEKLHKATGNTVILVSHSMEDVGRYADRILVMYKGKAVYYDTPTVVFRHVDELEKMGLAVPEVKYLMRALKKRYPEIDDDIFTVEAAKAEIERVFGGERDV